MATLAFCRECFTWGEPRQETCPHCGAPFDLNQADPSPAELTARIGPIIAPLGEARVVGFSTRQHGMLYATGGGLFFLPHEFGPPRQAAISPTRAFVWTIIGMAFPLIAFIRWLLWLGGRRVPTLEPRWAHDEASLADWLMADPAAFFLDRRTIRVMRRGWRGWVVECDSRAALCFRPMDPTLFASRLTYLADHDPWRDVTLV